MRRFLIDDTRAILIVAGMECRRVAGRFVAPAIMILAVVMGLEWFLPSQFVLSVR